MQNAANFWIFRTLEINGSQFAHKLRRYFEIQFQFQFRNAKQTYLSAKFALYSVEGWWDRTWGGQRIDE